VSAPRSDTDGNQRRCPKCNFKLFPVGRVREIRFHHLRHTTASLLLMNGADLAAVQRIMRHQDPRTTTEFYGQGAPHYLKKEIERLSFGPPPEPAICYAAGTRPPKRPHTVDPPPSRGKGSTRTDVGRGERIRTSGILLPKP